MTQTSGLVTEEDVKFFQDNGYWISPKIISDERLELLREHMEMVYNEQYETGVPPAGGWNYRTGDPNALRKTDSAHFADRALYALATDPVIGEIAAKLMRADIIRLFDTQLLHKPGRGKPGTTAKANVGWHQDYVYWKCCDRPSLLTAWVAFDDVHPDNGCMQVITGSHHWGLLNVNDFFEQDLEEQEKNFDLPPGVRFEKVPIIMKAGQVSFHHCLVMHGSGRNVTDSPRRSLAIHLMTGNVRYSTKGYPFYPIQMAKLRDGDLFEGEPFPVLYGAK